MWIIDKIKLIKAKELITNDISVNLETPQAKKVKGEIVFDFPLTVKSKSSLPFYIESITCEFTYKGLLIQTLFFKSGDIYASNGTEMILGNILPKQNRTINCLLRPFPYLPSLPEPNEKWGIKGSIKLKCLYGLLNKEFEFIDKRIETEKWINCRSEYQRLYSSVFGRKVTEVY